jgi:soluble lytic murein transglycosylase-like protein
MKILPPILAALALASVVPATASAGTLYKCTGADGIPNYTGKKIAGSHCAVVSTYTAADSRAKGPAPVLRPAAPAPAASAAAPKAVPASRVTFTTAAAGQALPAATGGRVSRGAVYKFEKDGVVHYTNVAPAGGAAKAQLLFSYIESCYACGAAPGVDFGNVALNMDSYAAEVRAAANEYGVEEAIVRAIIHAESAFRANAVSHAGAQGLMQLIPATASRFGVSDAFDPAQNIRGGVKYLAWLLNRFDNDLTLAAAGYNAGEGAVDKYGGVPPYAETQRYVVRVGQLAERYRGALGAGATRLAAAP